LATLADMAAAGRSDVLPGYILSAPRLREWGEAEAEAGRWHVTLAREASAGLPADVQTALVQQALNDVADGRFGMGMPWLDAFLRSARAAAFVFWLCLKVKHPHVTRDAAADLLTEDNEDAVFWAVLESWGMLPAGSKKKREARLKRSPAPSTGPPSSDSSVPSGGTPEPKSST
jgi:hypothetical protein